MRHKGSHAYGVQQRRQRVSSAKRLAKLRVGGGPVALHSVATTLPPPIAIRAGLRALSQDRQDSTTLIREAFDEAFFSKKYRRRFMGWTLERDAFARAHLPRSGSLFDRAIQTSGDSASGHRALEPHGVALDTYLRFVNRDRLDPHADFSEESYLRANPDVMDGVTAGTLLCGFEHWLRYGAAEGRTVSRASAEDDYTNPIFEEFDATFFSKKYRRRFSGRDLRTLDTALSLYVSFASSDSLDPNPGFSESDYLRENPDVENAVQRGVLSSGFAHWVTFGRKEGRDAFPALTFDGPPSSHHAAIIPNARSAIGANPLYLRQEEFDEMLRYFDEDFFRRTQQRSLPAVAGGAEPYRPFHDYLDQISTRMIDPNAQFSESHYLACNPDVATAVREGGYLCGYHHWALHGRVENRTFRSASARAIGLARDSRVRSPTDVTLVAEHRSAFRNVFQYSFYRAFFPIPRHLDADAAFDYFMDVDLMNGVVPVDENTFDERFYLSYYGDVQAEKAAGRLPSGYFHYILAGCAERRMPTYRPGPLLKAKLGDSADPTGIANVGIITKRLQPIVPRIQSTRPSLMNVFIPTLDGDVMFGGYIAFLNFLCRVVEAGFALRFIIREDPYGNAAWFLQSIGNRPRWLKAFSGQEVVNATVIDDDLAFHSNDLCIAYSTWTMFDAWSVCQHLQQRRPLFFIQEYEPIFHDHNSFGFIMSSAYTLPHLAIFNSCILAQYFRENDIGVFAEPDPRPFFAFENPLTPARAALRPARPARRRLLCYARPERHAGRNMFEVCILALREAIKRGMFPGDWEFLGIGSLGQEYEIDLGQGAVLTILPRMPQTDYEQFLLSFDVGLSLMWAPHPSVMPFELAAAGVVTVTNEYANSRRETAKKFGTNLILATPTLNGIVTGLQEAVRRSENMDARHAASAIDWPRSWDDVFPEPLIHQILVAAQH